MQSINIKQYCYTGVLAVLLMVFFSFVGNNSLLFAAPSADVTPKSSTIKQGEKIVFSDSSEQKGVRYFWALSGQTSSKASFSPNTKNLKQGRHRVLLTITDAERKQAHAHTVLTVIANQQAVVQPVVNTAVTMPSLLGKTLKQAKVLLEKKGLTLGKVNIQKSGTTKGVVLKQSIKANTETLKGSVVVLAIAGPKSIEKKQSKPATKGQLLLDINPTSQSVTRGDIAVFSNKHELKMMGARYYWGFERLNSTRRQFRIDTIALPVGKYTITANLSQKGKASIKKTAILEVRERLNKRMPNLIGLPVSQAIRVLKEDGFQVGKINQQLVNSNKSSVIKQSLRAGTMTKTGLVIYLVEGIPRDQANSKIILKANKRTLSIDETLRLQVVLNPKPKDNKKLTYIFTINGQQHITDKPIYTTQFNQLGSIPIHAVVRNKQGALGRSSVLRVNVVKVWKPPEARILPEVLRIRQGDKAEFTSTSLYDVNSRLYFAWSSKTGDKGAERRFIFSTKNIKPGEYEINLNVKDNRKKTSSANAKLVVYSFLAEKTSTQSFNRASSSPTQALAAAGLRSFNERATVTVEEIDDKPNLYLEVSDFYVRTGHKITLLLGSDIETKAIKYSFDKGDGEVISWQNSNQFVYQYNRFGRFRVQAAVRIKGKEYKSQSHTIWVWSPMFFVMIALFGGGLLALIWWWTGRTTQTRSYKTNRREIYDTTRITFRQLFIYFLQFLLSITLVLIVLMAFIG